MDRKDLVKKWLVYKEGVINDMTDYSENDIFIEDNNISDEDFEFLIKLPLTVKLTGNLK